MKDTYYITTPIYYPSNKLHIGHSYTTVAADTMARYKKQRGFDVKFLTGTDEHGQKIERLAKAAGVTPKEYIDKIVVWIKDLWKTMNVEYDIFLRTTDEIHVKAVQKIFRRLYEQGDIYKNEYEGMYCTPCETFFTERQLVEGKCPDCGRAVEKVKEESYFFRMSKYQDRLLKYIEDNPEFIMPVYRRNEMVSFIKSGLEDLCVSRTSFKWGIPVDFDDAHVVYVWIDALSNYATALGFLSDDDSEYKNFWPADVHLVAKDIVRFHTIIWPIMLMALEQPLPKQVFAHGYLIIDGGKMSKSKGNVVDPKILIERYGVDAIRYFLLREFAFGQDGNFTNEGLIQRINFDLANDLGNLVSRTVGMIDKYFEGQLPEEHAETAFDKELKELAEKVFNKAQGHLDKLEFSDALIEIWNLIRRANKYVDETEPWVLAKDAAKKPVLTNVLYNLSETLRIVSILIGPVMPNTKDTIFQQLNIQEEHSAWDSGKNFGRLGKQVRITKGAVIFPRIDVKKELESLNEQVTIGSTKEEKTDNVVFISIEDFNKVEMKMGKVIASERIEGSDKLLKSQVQVGGKAHQIVSGIGKSYAPEEIVGKNVVVVTNLKPVKLKGQLSEGMLLAASDDKGLLRLITSDGDIADGTVVK